MMLVNLIQGDSSVLNVFKSLFRSVVAGTAMHCVMFINGLTARIMAFVINLCIRDCVHQTVKCNVCMVSDINNSTVGRYRFSNP